MKEKDAAVTVGATSGRTPKITALYANVKLTAITSGTYRILKAGAEDGRKIRKE